MIQKPRGTKDIYSEEMDIYNYIAKVTFNVMKKYGFNEISTPIFEKSELFLKGVGEDTDIVNKEMYTFDDKGGRSITLRPEGTAGVARAYIEEALEMKMGLPLKLMYNMQVFRYEKVQKGRQRQFTQIGGELFGSPNPYADFEIIKICMEILKELKIDKNIVLKINSLGNKESRENYKKVLAEYSDKNIEKYCVTCQRRRETNILRMLDCKEKECKKLNNDAPKIIDYLTEEDKNHFEELKKYLDTTKLKGEYEVDPYIVRGLDYYNRTVFEILDADKKAILGGGRYDGLIEKLGGKSTEAVGFAFGGERVKDIILEKYTEKQKQELKQKVDYVIVKEYGVENNIYANTVAERLREKGFVVIDELMDKSFKAQMKNANKIGAKKAIIIGKEEVQNGVLTIKDMESGEQIQIDKEEI